MPTGFLSVEDVAARLGVEPSTIRAYSARGQMPAPDVRIGRTPGWRVSTIERWQARRAKANPTRRRNDQQGGK